MRETPRLHRLADDRPFDNRALGPLKHGLTGARVYFRSEEERADYKRLCESLHQSLVPATELEHELVEAACNDRYRMNRAVELESIAMFEAGEGGPGQQAATFFAKSAELSRISLYHSRLQRSYERNVAELRRVQAERKAALQEAIAEAEAIAESHAAANPTAAPEPPDAGAAAAASSTPTESAAIAEALAEPFLSRNFVFSNAQITAMLGRHRRLHPSKAPAKALRTAAA